MISNFTILTTLGSFIGHPASTARRRPTSSQIQQRKLFPVPVWERENPVARTLTVVLESADGPRLVGVNAIVGPIPLFDFGGAIAMIFSSWLFS